MDVAEFLRERLDEDEAAAKAWLPLGNPDAAQREHIARQDPGRVLRDVASKRAILDMDTSTDNNAEWGGFFEAHDLALRHLAQAYADHPDYKAEWKP